MTKWSTIVWANCASRSVAKIQKTTIHPLRTPVVWYVIETMMPLAPFGTAQKN